LGTNWIPHNLTGDVTYRGFTLKKVQGCVYQERNTTLVNIFNVLFTTQGTSLLPSPHKAFKSKEIFGKDAEEFRPERFLDPNDNSKLSDLKKFVTPFGVGKRKCPGESLGQIVPLILLVSTVKNFKLSPVPGENPPQLEFVVGVTSKPKPFRFLLTRR